MRLLISALTIAIFLGSSTIAHADTITFSVSVVGSGSIGTESFTDQRVTFTASVPEQDLLETFSESGDNPGSFATCAIPASTATVQGIDTFSGPGLTCVVHNFETSDTFQIGDGEGDLSISVSLAFDSFQSSVGPVSGSAYVNFNSCDPGGLTPCPPFFSTGEGALTFTSFIADTGSASMIITSPTPEPSTFVLLGTGLLGLGILSKRFSLA